MKVNIICMNGFTDEDDNTTATKALKHKKNTRDWETWRPSPDRFEVLFVGNFGDVIDIHVVRSKK
jgi:hypothetical protein